MLRTLVQNIVVEFKRLLITQHDVFPQNHILINNVLRRNESKSLNAAGQWLNQRPGNLAAAFDYATYVDIGSDILDSDFSPHHLHLNRDDYYYFAEQVVQECTQQYAQKRDTCKPRYPPLMVPPLVKKKSAKQMKKKKRRQYFSRVCRDVPVYQTCVAGKTSKKSKEVSSGSCPLHTCKPNRATPKPLHCYHMIRHRLL